MQKTFCFQNSFGKHKRAGLCLKLPSLQTFFFTQFISSHLLFFFSNESCAVSIFLSKHVCITLHLSYEWQ